jgi:hypothetical protein
VKVEIMKVKMQCEYCGGPIDAKPKVLEFANFQRFFCCIGCKNHYKERMKTGYGPIGTVQRDAKRGEKTNMILVESNQLVPSKSGINNVAISIFAQVIVKTSY